MWMQIVQVYFKKLAASEFQKSSADFDIFVSDKLNFGFG